MRIVIADDEMLLREGLARLLADAGFDVVAKAADGPELLRAVRLTDPDVAIIDIKMPPTHTDEGLVAAREIRSSHPGVGVLVLSHYLESRLCDAAPPGPSRAGRLPAQGARLRHRRARRRAAAHRRRRVRAGPDDRVPPASTARARRSPLAELTDREREVLELIAEGRSNQGIGDKLVPEPQDRRNPHPPDLPEARARRDRPTPTAACLRCSPSCVPDGPPKEAPRFQPRCLLSVRRAGVSEDLRQAPALDGGCRSKVCAVRSLSAGIEQAFALVAGLIAAWGLSGPGGGYLVLVELERVVGGGDQSPFRAHRRSASSLEAVDAPVVFGLREHGLR